MLIIRDCVSKNICNLCNKEIDSFLEKRVWSLSDTTWHPYLQEGIPGTCAASPPSRLVEIKVRSAVKKYLPDLPREQIVLNYHYWLKYSGVNWHEDKKYIFGATLYLNEWDKKWGGLFFMAG